MNKVKALKELPRANNESVEKETFRNVGPGYPYSLASIGEHRQATVNREQQRQEKRAREMNEQADSCEDK